MYFPSKLSTRKGLCEDGGGGVFVRDNGMYSEVHLIAGVLGHNQTVGNTKQNVQVLCDLVNDQHESGYPRQD